MRPHCNTRFGISVKRLNDPYDLSGNFIVRHLGFENSKELYDVKLISLQGPMIKSGKFFIAFEIC